MQSFLANLASENRFSWFFPVAIALIAVLAAEVVCIVFLVRRLLAAKNKEDGEDGKGGGIGLSSMALMLVSEGGIAAREGWLIALGVLALLGAVALAALIGVCYFRGVLFVAIEPEKKPQKKINILGFMPISSKKKTADPGSEGDIDSAIAAFSDADEEPAPEKVPAPAYTAPVFPDEDDSDADEDAEDGIDDLDGDLDAEEDYEDQDASDDPDLFTGNERIVGYDAETDSNIIARYRKSFEAKLIQSQPQIKKYYSALKNALLSYKGTKSRMSWTIDSFHNGRTQLAKINVKTRILELYLALDPASLEGTVYRGQDVGALRKYEETPFRYKIRTPRKFNWALELIRRVCEEHGLTRTEEAQVDYESRYPFDTMDNLVKRKLVKVTLRKEKAANTFEYGGESHAPAVSTPYMPEEVQDEVVAPEMDFAPAQEEPETVPAAAMQEEAPLFEEQQAGPEFAPVGQGVNPDLAQVDVSLLDLHFNNGDLVTLNILKRKGLVFSGATRLKIRASGKMTRKLKIVANQFTYDALVAIEEAGGEAQFLR